MGKTWKDRIVNGFRPVGHSQGERLRLVLPADLTESTYRPSERRPWAERGTWDTLSPEARERHVREALAG